MSRPQKLPDFVYLPPEFVGLYAQQTRKGVYNLLSFELVWKDRYEFLEKRGYLLRPRYHPKWEPSWLGTNITPDFCEDSIKSSHSHVMDATRKSDGSLVTIKCVKKASQEIAISLFIASISGPDDHCVSAIEALPDPLDDSRALLVMPYLRPYNYPELQVVGDVADFASQMLQGLAFLHRNSVAHRDIAPSNIMMDARPIYPEGYHPVRMHRAPDGVHDAIPLPRIDHPVKYYYIDFGLSTLFPPGAPSTVIGRIGRDMEIPELSDDVPYDAYKADIYALGNLFDKEFLQPFGNVQFLQHLVECMKQPEPDLRPPADELIKMFRQLRALIPESSIRWRLVQRSELPYERFINNTVAVARDSLSSLKRMVG